MLNNPVMYTLLTFSAIKDTSVLPDFPQNAENAIFCGTLVGKLRTLHFFINHPGMKHTGYTTCNRAMPINTTMRPRLGVPS